MTALNGKPKRERVERGIYKRKTADGKTTRYEIVYTDSDGRLRWETLDKLQQARERRGELVAKVKSGVRVAPEKITFADYADGWLERQTTLRPKTQDLYGSYLNSHVKPRLGRQQLQSITVDDVADLIASMQKGERYREQDGRLVKVEGKPFAAWTIRGTLAVLGRVLGSAARAGVIPANPVRRLERGERPKVTRRRFPSLDAQTIGLLIASTPKRYRTIVAVSVLTGLRQGEALGLRWQDVDVKAGEIRVRWQLDRRGDLVEPKTDEAKRDIPIPESLAKMLAQHRLASDPRHSAETDFIFCSETGGPMHYRNVVRRGLDKAVEAAGLPHLRWHDLRHLAASALIHQLRGDADPVSRILGHSSAAITLGVYAHEFEKVQRADTTRERMEAAYGAMLRT